MALSIKIAGAAFSKIIGSLFNDPSFLTLVNCAASVVSGRPVYTFGTDSDGYANNSKYKLLADGSFSAETARTTAGGGVVVVLATTNNSTSFDVAGSFGVFGGAAAEVRVTQGVTGNIVPNRAAVTYVSGMGLRLRRVGAVMFADVSIDEWATFTNIHEFTATSSVTLYPMLVDLASVGATTTVSRLHVTGESLA